MSQPFIRACILIISFLSANAYSTSKSEHGLTNPSLKSSHTVFFDGYVIEAHVPVSDIDGLLAERPAIVGLTAPGMPMMSPGVASETPRDYEIPAFDKRLRARIYSTY